MKVFINILIILSLSSCYKDIDENKDRKYELYQSEQSRDFKRKVGIANIAEIEYGKLALAKSQNAEIRKFGELMINEHLKAQSELKKISKKKALEIPDTLDFEHKVFKKELEILSGFHFDTAYINSQINVHYKTLNDFEVEIKYGKDKDNIEYAEKHLPSIQSHIRQIIKINNSIYKDK